MADNPSVPKGMKPMAVPPGMQAMSAPAEAPPQQPAAPAATISANPTGWMHPLNTLRLAEARLQSHLQGGVSPGVAQFMGSAVQGPLKAAEGALETASGHLLHGPADIIRGLGTAFEIPGALAGAVNPMASFIPVAPSLVGGAAVNKGLTTLGVSPQTASDVGTLTGAAIGMLPSVGLLPKIMPTSGTPSSFKKAGNYLEKALAPGRTSRNLDLRANIDAAAPDLRAIAQQREMRPYNVIWRRVGLHKENTAPALAAAMHDRASGIFDQRANLLAQQHDVFASQQPIADNIRGLIQPDVTAPEARYQNELFNDIAKPYDRVQNAENVVPVKSLEADRKFFRQNLLNRDYFKSLKPAEQRLAEAKHRGAVQAIENAMDTLQGADNPGSPAFSMRQLNMRGGRLDRLGDRLAIRAIGSSFRDPDTFDTLLRGGHTFVSAHGGIPYMGIFANPTALVNEARNPRGTNALARAALRQYARFAKESPLAAIRNNFGKLSPMDNSGNWATETIPSGNVGPSVPPPGNSPSSVALTISGPGRLVKRPTGLTVR